MGKRWGWSLTRDGAEIPHPAVGTVIPIPIKRARWMYVTRVTQPQQGVLVYVGVLWSVRHNRWTKQKIFWQQSHHDEGSANVS